MPNTVLPLKAVDGLEIISLIDNSIDFLSSSEHREVKNIREWMKNSRNLKPKGKKLPIAEHGFSMLIRIYFENEAHTILFDTGGSSESVLINAERMELDLSEIEAIVISHGHWDHSGGLSAISKTINKKNLPIIIHEDMLKTRGSIDSNGTVRKYVDFPKEKKVRPSEYIVTKQPYLLSNNSVLVTGEIPRQTDFERGYLRHRALVNGKWQPDPWIWDDRAVIINIKQKGLVVLSGCAHAGIINTTLYSKELTGVSNIYAIMGGFHLIGKNCENKIQRTVIELKTLNPKLLVPSHCTGWRGVHAIAKAFPHAFVKGSVGNLYTL
ncbi:MBL fold metallo-hydrolase [Candidatus Bathyarchaeota archaeon]|nr:MBL fold metallo-hydrolase [Candidatus Bathyarchaeota archaeon]